MSERGKSLFQTAKAKQKSKERERERMIEFVCVCLCVMWGMGTWEDRNLWGFVSRELEASIDLDLLKGQAKP